jgi:2-amino-4-hydroxy-6-hydroxymethyldihydropteridine diphosphokinase
LIALADAAGTRLTAISTFYKTRPVGAAGNADFYNGVIALRTSLPAEVLSTLLGDVEARCGRRPSPDRHAPRTIDLDLLLYGDMEARRPEMTLPHPDIPLRSFVALPLLELAPELVLPGPAGPLAQWTAAFDEPPGEPLAEFTSALRRSLPA